VNFYPRYPAHYVAKTLHLTMEQDGAYTRLLDWYYANERGIPHAQRYAIARAQTPSERRSTDAVLDQFFTQENGVWANGRSDDEIATAQPKIKAARENGRLGGRPKKNPPGSDQKPTGFSTETHNEPSAKAPQSPIPNVPTDTPQRPPPAAAVALEGVFEGHEAPRETPNPAAAYAIALTRAGFQVTSMNPDLIAYVDGGGTVTHLQQVASLPDCAGKKAGYVLAIARRELADQAKAITGGSHANRPQGRESLVDRAAERASRILGGAAE
jgi:uncharacterized protein YdaU (DUF1376 family)